MDIGRSFYEKPPDAKQLAAWGLKPSDYPEQTIDIWPAHVNAYRLFAQVTTQWRVGLNGATGLDYSAVLSVLDRTHADKTADERMDIFRDMQVIERGALTEMHTNKS